MTTYTVTTHRHEADAIVRGDKMYIMRGTAFPLESRIKFRVKEIGSDAKHIITDQEYAVSYVDAGEPIQDGITLMGIRRVK